MGGNREPSACKPIRKSIGNSKEYGEPSTFDITTYHFDRKLFFNCSPYCLMPWKVFIICSYPDSQSWLAFMGRFQT